MGTGLGPKSYAIINQGTASKLIESKPEEFRVYLEEVAGISKYRERKRETENKIRHTKENLDRLNDVVSEVSKQLKTLERQAIQADKYKKLTEEKKVIKSEILAISIRDFQESIEIKNNKIETKRTKLEKKQSEISSINAQEEKLKITYQSLNEEMNETQKQYYNALSEVGRTEQAIEYEKDGAERNKKQYQNALESIDKIRNVLNTDNDKLIKYKSEINELGEMKNIKSSNISKMKKDKDYINNDLSNKKEILEVEIKKIYESEQSIKNKEEKIKDFNHNIIRIKKDIEEYTITSQKILTELKNIESYELDNKIKEYDLEIKIFKDNINSLDNKDIITSANKIQDILKKIKDVVKTIQSSEFDLAKKNEQIKNDIDNKITSEINRLDAIVKDDMQNKDSLSRLNNEVKMLQNTIIDSKNNLDKINKNLNTITSDLTIENNSLHSVELKMETKKVEINNLVQNIENNNNELKLMTGNIKLLKFSDTSPDSKLSELKENLSEGLKIQNIKDIELKKIRSSITDLSDKILLLEDSKIKTLNDLDEIKSEISEDEKNIQEIVGQVKIIKEQLEELEVNSKSILDADINYDLVKWKKRENELITIIDRMGAINLAAIDQFKEYDERKSYLIMQKEDLLSALNSLEEAIRKIDKDTKERFKNTFDQVNLKLQEIFPKLFNGGKAYLKMTENDLLKTGVAVFASPPGKKLTSINLLSGGEKALTALSLVFALFSLNPSPFCMLDEVDAPLDDVNIERFCNLFTEMSEKIQFIIITHKKITMEYVEQLIGVTMGEKGVSKLVNVSMQDVGMQDQI